ncbi:MAG: hypothetical protein SO123_03720, partial [Eubacteriales bacterium]|nr:hypothetical protein [Eubacteriales bacterium]
SSARTSAPNVLPFSISAKTNKNNRLFVEEDKQKTFKLIYNLFFTAQKSLPFRKAFSLRLIKV